MTFSVEGTPDTSGFFTPHHEETMRMAYDWQQLRADLPATKENINPTNLPGYEGCQEAVADYERRYKGQVDRILVAMGHSGTPWQELKHGRVNEIEAWFEGRSDAPDGGIPFAQKVVFNFFGSAPNKLTASRHVLFLPTHGAPGDYTYKFTGRLSGSVASTSGLEARVPGQAIAQPEFAVVEHGVLNDIALTARRNALGVWAERLYEASYTPYTATQFLQAGNVPTGGEILAPDQLGLSSSDEALPLCRFLVASPASPEESLEILADVFLPTTQRALADILGRVFHEKNQCLQTGELAPRFNWLLDNLVAMRRDIAFAVRHALIRDFASAFTQEVQNREPIIAKLSAVADELVGLKQANDCKPKT